MAGRSGKAGSGGGLANRLASWRARRAPIATGFVSMPEPRSLGLFSRGKQLVTGHIQLGGVVVLGRGAVLWDLEPPNADFTAEAHGFGWLDDLAALGTPEARKLALDWTLGWISRYVTGKGPGWTPALTGRRVTRWIHHANFLLGGQDKPVHETYFAAISRQAYYLAQRAEGAPDGIARFEALHGLLVSGLVLTGLEDYVIPALEGMILEVATEIGPDGASPSRNPEELLDILTHLTWAVRALAEADRPIPPQLSEAIDRIAPCLRVLRHADGGLARFHGGDSGAEGRLEQALSASAMPRPPGHLIMAMGYARLSGGRSSVIMDAAAPPDGPARATAHASTGAFELTSGRRPVIVSCGSGLPFGADWRLAGRATQSHSVLSLAGVSSSRFGRRNSDILEECARISGLQRAEPDGALIYLAHDGWSASHGLTAGRELYLSADGRQMGGTDMLLAQTAAERARFSELLDRSLKRGIEFAIRFHLHPDADATLDMGGAAVSIQLRSGEIWVFRHDGVAALTLQPSVYLEKGRLQPRATKQIVLAARARNFETRIDWTLAKAQDTPLAIRDLDRDDPVPI